MASGFHGRDVLLVGGEHGPTTLDDAWEWNGETWKAALITGSPGARSGLGLVRSGGQVVCFGGVRGPSLLRGTWVVQEASAR